MTPNDVKRIRKLAGTMTRLAELASSRTVEITVQRTFLRQHIAEYESGDRKITPAVEQILRAVESDLTNDSNG